MDIGINYTDRYSRSTGWRVFDKTGSGSNGELTLISSGSPLAINKSGADSGTIHLGVELLSDINKTLTINESDFYYWTHIGFLDDNLKSVLTTGRSTNTEIGFWIPSYEELADFLDYASSSSCVRDSEFVKSVLVHSGEIVVSKTISYNPAYLYTLHGTSGLGGWASSFSSGVKTLLKLKVGTRYSIELSGDGSSEESSFVVVE